MSVLTAEADFVRPLAQVGSVPMGDINRPQKDR
jgi:hypothetical protein